MDAFSDLAFFRLLMQHGSLSAAAQPLGVTPPSVSKRLAALEARLGVRLLQRTTRRLSLTPEGQLYLEEGARLLQDMDELERRVTGARAQPQGLLRVAGTLGFGRQHVAPQVSAFAQAYPAVEVCLSLTDRPINLVEQGFDVAISLGELPDARLSVRQLARNRRVLCAAPSYLTRAGEPATPRELAQHQCLVLRENDDIWGSWSLRRGSEQETVKVGGALSSNDGACVLGWALDGHGVMQRSLWDAAPYLRSGRLRQILPDWELPTADVQIVFAHRAQLSARVRVFVDFMLARFEPYRQAQAPYDGW